MPDGYRMVGYLGHGAQSTVYLAVQKSTGRRVAIKMLDESVVVTSRGAAGFEREAEIVASLNHPGIVKMYDRINLGRGRTALVLEFVDGKTLEEWHRALGVRQGSAKSTRHSIATLMADVCDAVAHAHQNGVAHRDLKPGNIIVDAAGKPKVLDFGIAKIMDGDRPATATWDAPATPEYASPEQLDNRPVDVRTDVYSIGVMLYELLARRRPFRETRSRTELLRSMQKGPVNLRKRDRSIEQDLSVIVSKALEADPQRRYQSTGSLGQDLRQYVRGAPISARSDSHGYLLWKVVRQHWVSSAALLAVVLLSVGAAVWLGVMNRETQRLYLSATSERERADEAVEALRETIAENRLELGRRLASSGFVHGGVEAVWREFFDTFPRNRGSPTRRIAALWALRELYWRDQCLATLRVSEGKGWAAIGVSGDVLRWLDPKGEMVEVDVASRKIISRTKLDNPESLKTFGLADDATHAIALTQDGTLERWNVVARRVEARLRAPEGMRSGGLSRSNRDGSRILVSRADGIDLVDFEAGVVEHVAAGKAVRGADFDGRERVWIHTTDQRLWKLENQVLFLEADLDPYADRAVPVGTGQWLTSMRVDEDGTRVKAFLMPQVWDIEVGNSRRATPLEGVGIKQPTRILSDGSFLTLVNDRDLGRFVEGEGRASGTARGHGSALCAVAEDARRGELITCDVEGVIKWWPMELGSASRIAQDWEHQYMPTDILGLEGDKVCLTGNFGDMRIVSIRDGLDKVWPAHDQYSSALTKVGGEHEVLTVGYDGLVKLWDASTWKCMKEVRVGESVLTSVTVDDRTGVWAAGGSSGVIALGTLRPFEKRLEVWLADVKRVNKVVMSPSARMVAASTSEGQVVLVDVARGDEVRRLQVLDSTGVGVRLVRRVAWAGEERLLTGDDDGRLGIWQVSTGACERMIDAHSSAISGLEWWEREHVAMTVDRKGTVKIWGVNAPMPLAAVEFPVQRVSDVKLDRGRLLVAAWSQVCGAWDVAAQDQSLRDNFDYYFEVYERGGGTAKREDVEAWLRERLLGTPGDAMEE